MIQHYPYIINKLGCYVAFIVKYTIPHFRHVDIGSRDHLGNLTERPESRRLGSFVALSLNFTLRPEHVTEDRVLRLKCTAEVTELYWRTAEVSVTVSPLSPRNWFSSHTPGHTFSSEAGLSSAPLSYLLLLCNYWILRNV